MRTIAAVSVLAGAAALPLVIWLFTRSDLPEEKPRTQTASSGLNLRTAHPGAVPHPPEPAEPEYVPPSTKDTGLAAFVDRNAKERVTADITSRLPCIRNEEDVPAVVAVLLDTQDNDTVRNEAANLLLRSGYDGFIRDLTRILGNPDEKPRFRSFCVQKLWENARHRPEDRGRTLTIPYELLEDKEVPVRREALLAFVRMRDPGDNSGDRILNY